jgi:hypothetical protein
MASTGGEAASTPRGATEGDGESKRLWEVLRDPNRKNFFSLPTCLDVLEVLVLSVDISMWEGDDKKVFKKRVTLDHSLALTRG